METLHYLMRLVTTKASTGYVTVTPEPPLDFAASLRLLRDRPFDLFLHNHALRQLGEEWSTEDIAQALEAEGEDLVLDALVHEACLVPGKFSRFRAALRRERLEHCAAFSPGVLAGQALASLADAALHRQWMELFSANALSHAPLPRPKDAGLPFPYTPETLGSLAPPGITIEHVLANGFHGPESGSPRVSPLETAARAEEALGRAGFLDGHREMRHTASLAHAALLRQWELALRVSIGRARYTLKGVQTSYGRGFRPEFARAGLYMEMAERVSAHAGFDENGPVGYRADHGLIRATHAEMLASGREALDPNTLSPDAPYTGWPLHWARGTTWSPDGERDVYVPAQCVFMFSNLDERALHAAPGSTGLGAGNTMAEARLQALLEAVERDALATRVHHPGRCFCLGARDPVLADVLDDYARHGITARFGDRTSWLGVPCVTCFVIHRDGAQALGASAKLSGPRAAMSALTETPYPFPNGPVSAIPRGLGSVPVVPFEDIPDYSRFPEWDLALLETVLAQNGMAPVHVDLTREDLGIPVVRSVVPGLSAGWDADAARVPPRLFADYLKVFEEDASGED